MKVKKKSIVVYPHKLLPKIYDTCNPFTLPENLCIEIGNKEINNKYDNKLLAKHLLIQFPAFSSTDKTWETFDEF